MAGLGFKLGESGQLLQFGFGPNPLHRHGQHRRQRKKEVDLVLGEPPLPRGVRAQDAEGLPMAGEIATLIPLTTPWSAEQG